MFTNIEIKQLPCAELIETGVQIEKIATGFDFIEGPVWHPYEKYLIFSDIIGNHLYRWSAADGVTLFRKPSYMANGNTFDRAGRLLTCEHATSRVTRTEHNGSVTVLATHYDGKELNSPNDIAVKSDGSIYFTDPNSGRSAGYGIPRAQQLPFQGVYRLDPDTNSLALLVDDFSKPNGLCFSRDEKRLFVSDSAHQHIRVFDVRDDGTLANGRVWAKAEATGIGVVDGMKIDRAENLYCTGPGGIHLYTARGDYLGIIYMPEHTTNLAWGDDDFRSLYITAATSLYRLRVKVPGLKVF